MFRYLFKFDLPFTSLVNAFFCFERPPFSTVGGDAEHWLSPGYDPLLSEAYLLFHTPKKDEALRSPLKL